jgi:hypothetical protein
LVVVGGPEVVHQVRDVRASFFEAIGEGDPTSAFALESGAPFCVPIFFEPEKHQPLSTPALENDALRTEEGVLRLSLRIRITPHVNPLPLFYKAAVLILTGFMARKA